MTGTNLQDNPIPPANVEPWYVAKKRQLEWDRNFYDGGVASLTDALREERMETGYYILAELSTNAVGTKMRALQSGLIQLSKWHSDTLAELARL